LILAISLPVLALGFLVSYLLARSLTRPLEAVSRVTSAIASGDLAQRAPVKARNEVGQLAKDVNSMAAHLESSIGELRAARARAVDALHTRQELVASISHELRTPLAILHAHLESLAGSRVATAGEATHSERAGISVPETTLHALQSETERLASLVEDLFALSRAEAGGMQVEIQPVDASALVNEVAEVMGPLVQREGKIALSVRVQPGIPSALADPDRVRQILANLVRNAVRHTPEGGIIAITVEAQESWIMVAVADTGEGIPAEHLPHIFERFYRVDRTRSRATGGTGLGLAIVRHVAQAHGGEVSVESEEGKGSTFRLKLPLAAATRSRRTGRS
jgi:signal transduction histidine kinase